MFKRLRHMQLLGSLSLLLVLDPFLQSGAGFTLVDVLLVVTLVSAVAACARRPQYLIIGIVLMLPLQAIALARIFGEMETLDVAHAAFGVIFFGYVAALVLSDVFRTSSGVSADTICGALAAYLLIGIGWSFAYALLDQLVPGSIAGLREQERPGRYEGYLSYSFVTLTTLGYGNVVPGNARADALAVAEAIVGQVYLTVLVARLVALNLLSSQQRSTDKHERKEA